MPQSKTTSRSAKPPVAASDEGVETDMSKSAVPAEPVLPHGELTKVIAELQARIETVEKQKSTAPRKKRTATNPETGPATIATPSASQAPPVEPADRKLEALRDRELSLDIEEAALRTRAKAAAQEELLIRHETQTLQLKLRSFNILTRKLRDTEAALAARSEALDLKARQLADEAQALEQTRQELALLRADLQTEQALISEREVALAAPFAAMASHRDVPIQSQASSPIPNSSIALATSLAVIAIIAAAAIAIAISWLTIEPVYRATATIAPVATPATTPAELFNPSIRGATRSLLEQRGLLPFESDEAMAAALNERMTITTGEKSEVTLWLESTRRDEAVLILEALSRSYAKANADQKVTITRAAAADLAPLRDDRPGRAGLYFAMIVLSGAAIAFVTRIVLSRRA